MKREMRLNFHSKGICVRVVLHRVQTVFLQDEWLCALPLLVDSSVAIV